MSASKNPTDSDRRVVPPPGVNAGGGVGVVGAITPQGPATAGQTAAVPLTGLGVNYSGNGNFALGSNSSDLNHFILPNRIEDRDTRYRNLRSVTASQMLMDCCRIGPTALRADDNSGKDNTNNTNNDNTMMLGDLEDETDGDAQGGVNNDSLAMSGRGGGSFAGRPSGTYDPLCGSYVISGDCFISPPPQEEEGGEPPEGGPGYLPPAQGFDRDLSTAKRKYSSPTKDSNIGTAADGNMLRMSCYRRGE